MDAAKSVSEPLHGFFIESVRLVRRCNKPDRKEFLKITTATAVGFAVMGFIGFFVRLIHIPVNSILLGTFACLPRAHYRASLFCLANMRVVDTFFHFQVNTGCRNKCEDARYRRDARKHFACISERCLLSLSPINRLIFV